MIKAQINSGEIKNVLKDALEEVHMATSIVIPAMKEASATNVLKSIKDPTCLMLHKGSEQAEQLLEEIMPDEEIPSRQSVVGGALKAGNLTNEQWELITELFEVMEVAYDHEARACSCLVRLSKTLNAQQLQVMLQGSIRPLITLKALPKYMEQSVTQWETKSHHEDKTDKLMLTVMPDMTSHHIMKEKVNSPTHLLVATFAFKMINKFGGRTMQRKMQEIYEVKVKQLASHLHHWAQIPQRSRKEGPKM